jgi:transposase-like protein
VLTALAQAAKDGSDVSVAAIARHAGVDRTFLYRHRDLLGQVHAQAAEPPTAPGGRGSALSRASLQADLLAADARIARLAAQVRRLEARLSEVLGEQVRRESGIGGPEDTEQFKARITTLEQQVIDLELKLQERDDDLAAARAANREPMAQLNRHPD